MDSPASTPASTVADTAAGTLESKLAPNSERLFGRAHVSLEEFLDLVEEASRIPGSLVMLSRVDEATGGRRSFPPVRIEDFDATMLIRRYGSGEFYARITQPGKRGAWRAVKFILDGLTPEASRTQSSFPSATPVPITQPTGVADSSSGQRDLFGIALTMMTNMLSQQQTAMQQMQQQQTQLFTAMLNQKSEPRGFNELEGLIKLTDHLSKRRDRDSNDDGGDVIQRITAGLVDGLLSSKPAPTPIPQATRPAAPARALPPGPVAPTAAAKPPQSTNTPDPSSSATGTSPAAGSSAPSATPVDLKPEETQEQVDMLNLSIGQKVRALAGINLLSHLLANATMMPAAIAEAMADALGDDIVDMMLESAQGQITAQLVKAQPSLAAHQERLLQVESALRDLYEDEPGDKPQADEDRDDEP